MKPRILLLDCETFPNLVFTWGLWNQTIGINQIVDAGYTLCWSAKWLGEKDIMFSSIHRDGNERMMKTLHGLLNEADIIIGYNSDRFDLPTINKEMIRVGLKPPSPYKKIDLLKTARNQFRFSSNKLDYIAQFLGLGHKVKHKGFELWKECAEGDEGAWRKMEAYNKHDVRLLERVYKVMKPWVKNHPNLNIWADSAVCPHCASKHIQARGTYPTKDGLYQRYQCKDCGSWFRGKKRLKKTEAVE